MPGRRKQFYKGMNHLDPFQFRLKGPCNLDQSAFWFSWTPHFYMGSLVKPELWLQKAILWSPGGSCQLVETSGVAFLPYFSGFTQKWRNTIMIFSVILALSEGLVSTHVQTELHLWYQIQIEHCLWKMLWQGLSAIRWLCVFRWLVLVLFWLITWSWCAICHLE